MSDYQHINGAKVAGTAICICGKQVEFKSNLVNATMCKCGVIVKNRNYKSNNAVVFHDSKLPVRSKIP